MELSETGERRRRRSRRSRKGLGGTGNGWDSAVEFKLCAAELAAEGFSREKRAKNRKRGRVDSERESCACHKSRASGFHSAVATD